MKVELKIGSWMGIGMSEGYGFLLMILVKVLFHSKTEIVHDIGDVLFLTAEKHQD